MKPQTIKTIESAKAAIGTVKIQKYTFDSQLGTLKKLNRSNITTLIEIINKKMLPICEKSSSD